MNTLSPTNDPGKGHAFNGVGVVDRLNAISLDEIRADFGNFLSFMMGRVKQTSEYDIQNFRYCLKSYLLAQLDSISSNTSLAKPKSCHNGSATSQSDFQPYFEWARGPAAASVGCMVFTLLTCMIGQGGIDSFSDIKQKFLAQDKCLHLAIMARMYNDYSSLDRDRTEVNLNSLNFAEFGVDKPLDHEINGVPKSKAKLLRLAKYVGRCAQAALTQLESMVEPRVSRVLKAF